MFRTDSSSVTGKLTYSTIFQLAAEGLTEFSSQILVHLNAPYLQNVLHFCKPLTLAPNSFGGGGRFMSRFTFAPLEWEKDKNPLQVFNQDLTNLSQSPLVSCCHRDLLPGYCVSSPCTSLLRNEQLQIPRVQPRASFSTCSPNFTADTSVREHNLYVTVKFWGITYWYLAFTFWKKQLDKILLCKTMPWRADSVTLHSFYVKIPHWSQSHFYLALPGLPHSACTWRLNSWHWVPHVLICR